jgi:hypothetical protein
MKKYLQVISLLFVVLTFAVSGCKKEKEEDFDTQSSQDDAQAESIMNEVNQIADQAVRDGMLSTHRSAINSSVFLTSCGSITTTIDSTDGSGSAAINFGAHFCQGLDSKFRKGLITVTFSGPYSSTGTSIIITVTNYFSGFDSIYATKVNGTRHIINNGLNSSGHLTYGIQSSGYFVNYLNQMMTWNNSRVREWTARDTTAAWTDDEYLITGNSGGTSFAGVNFSSTITKPLHGMLNCKWIVEGTVSLKPENKDARIVNYGSGSCDGDATVTIGEKVYQVTLR